MVTPLCPLPASFSPTIHQRERDMVTMCHGTAPSPLPYLLFAPSLRWFRGPPYNIPSGPVFSVLVSSLSHSPLLMKKNRKGSAILELIIQQRSGPLSARGKISFFTSDHQPLIIIRSEKIKSLENREVELIRIV